MFVGVFPVDKIPFLQNGQSCIFNNKTLRNGGEHWLSLIKNGDNEFLYDSFGRKKDEYIELHFLDRLKDVIESNYNQEQEYFETDCGPRCIAFLKLCYKYSPNTVVKYI